MDNFNFIKMMLQNRESPNPRGEKFQSRSDVKTLTSIPKNLYMYLNTYELEASRLVKYPEFREMIG